MILVLKGHSDWCVGNGPFGGKSWIDKPTGGCDSSPGKMGVGG